MPGNNNMMIGGAIFIIGAFITFLTYAAASSGGTGGYFVVTTGALVFGGFQFVVGLGQNLLFGMKGTEGRANHRAEVGMRVILRSMISMAEADGELEQSEILVIQVVSNSLFGWAVDEELIYEVYNNLLVEDEDIAQELADLRSQMTEEDRLLAIRAITMIAFADGEMDESERDRLFSYAGALDVTGDELTECVESGKSAIIELIAMLRESQNSDEEAVS